MFDWRQIRPVGFSKGSRFAAKYCPLGIWFTTLYCYLYIASLFAHPSSKLGQTQQRPALVTSRLSLQARSLQRFSQRDCLMIASFTLSFLLLSFFFFFCLHFPCLYLTFRFAWTWRQNLYCASTPPPFFLYSLIPGVLGTNSTPQLAIHGSSSNLAITALRAAQC